MYMDREQEKCAQFHDIDDLLRQCRHTRNPLRVVEGFDHDGWIRIDAGPSQGNGDPDWELGGETLIDESDLDAYVSQEVADRHRANFYLWAAAPDLVDAVAALRGVILLHGLEGDLAGLQAVTNAETVLRRALTLPSRPISVCRALWPKETSCAD